MEKTVLIVHRDIDVRAALEDCFAEKGYNVLCIDDGIEAMEITEDREFDFVLSGINLPGIDGFSVCRHIRKKYDSCIIFVERNIGDNERIMGFESGADDCISLPEAINIILLKINALLCRIRGIAPGRSTDIISAGGIEINDKSHCVTVQGQVIELAAKEYGLLQMLMENKGRVLTRENLLRNIWGYDYMGDTRAVDTHIKKLRAKLGVGAKNIKTVIRAGYKFEPDA